MIVFTQRLIAQQQFVAAQQEFGKVDHSLALALFIVERIEFDELAVEIIIDLDRTGAQALVLGVIDEIRHLARRIALVVDILATHETLDGGQLIS